MIVLLMVLTLPMIVAQQPGPPATAQTAAESITLRDGSVVKGLVTSAVSGARGSVEFVVRWRLGRTSDGQTA